MRNQITRRGFIVSGAAAALCGPAFAAARTLDTALVNAVVWTGDRALTDAVGISGNRIAALGKDVVRSATGRKTRVIDCGGAFVMPAFIDCHTHFLLGSVNLARPVFLDARSKAEFIDRIGAAVRAVPPGQWLTGGPWDEQRWGGELPRKEWVDAVSGDTPIAIPRTDLHSLFLNSAALRLAGIDRNTPDVPGGVIERDERGEPTGVLKDNATRRVAEVIPPLTDDLADRLVRQGIEYALSKGVAQVHNTEVDWSVQDAARRLRRADALHLRVYSFVPLADWERMATLVEAEGKGDDWLRWGALKCVSDGSLGARTARFHAPYLDAPDQRGVWTTRVEDMREWIPAADAAGLAISTHAIGDEANDVVLDIFADTERRNGRRDRRFRIEHAQHLSPGAWQRMAQQKVIASVQPYHAADDGRWAVHRIGEERLTRTYAFRSLIEAGVRTCFGSDWPVAPLDPMTGIDAAVQRHTIDGANPDGWHPEQRVSIEAALTAYTRTAAFAGFQEDRLGRIAPGYLADITVLDRNLLAAAPDQYLKANVLRTFVDGVERFTASSA
ncbi:amidohydrolase [Sphingosinicella microcystinivorans]|uniref:amidohydrolase n=1 Tax=Sphingosinicella microcystinivorans TaxID=335406 RepID=UPI0022F3AEB1|nr:amidohydrolase [Sphingosinicella microcystinivorans]WBX84221.1 amidohydrolase [Sphingosinicella microcystinivorans]